MRKLRIHIQVANLEIYTIAYVHMICIYVLLRDVHEVLRSKGVPFSRIAQKLQSLQRTDSIFICSSSVFSGKFASLSTTKVARK